MILSVFLRARKTVLTDRLPKSFRYQGTTSQICELPAASQYLSITEHVTSCRPEDSTFLLEIFPLSGSFIKVENFLMRSL